MLRDGRVVSDGPPRGSTALPAPTVLEETPA
jgi:hypothetical protein